LGLFQQGCGSSSSSCGARNFEPERTGMVDRCKLATRYNSMRSPISHMVLHPFHRLIAYICSA
jgi:hypothetical protein